MTVELYWPGLAMSFFLVFCAGINAMERDWGWMTVDLILAGFLVAISFDRPGSEPE